MGLSLIDTELQSLLVSDNSQGSQRNTDNMNSETSCNKVSEVLDITREIQMQANAATDVLNDLLHYDKIESGNLNLELSFLSIWDLVECTAHEFVIPASKKNIRLEILFQVDYDKKGQSDSVPIFQESALELSTIVNSMKDLPASAQRLVVVGDTVRMTQTIRNLISNAIKFTPEGGEIQVRTIWQAKNENTKVNSSDLGIEHGPDLEVHGWGSIAISVADTGVGMSPQQLDKLFRPGIQFHANTLQAGGGSGLGLCIAKGIVEQHKGLLSVVSEGLGRGTTFSVRLPVCLVPGLQDSVRLCKEKVSTSFDLSSDSSGASLRILIVDDSLSNRKLLHRLLKHEGHQCDQAENGKVALEMIAQAIENHEAYDCLLLDYEMDVMNGPDAAKEVRRRGYDLFIIGITGNVLREDQSFFLSCGANAVLPKPVKSAELQRLWVEYGLTGSHHDD